MAGLTVSELTGITTSINQVSIPAGHELRFEGGLVLDSTTAHTVATCTNATRPATPPVGSITFNTDAGGFQIYSSNGGWADIGSGTLALSNTTGSYDNPAYSGIDVRDAGRPSGYYWIRPRGWEDQNPRAVYVDNDLYDGGWVLVMAVGSNSTNHWDTFEANNLYNGQVDGITTDYVPYSGAGYSTSSGRRWDDTFIRAIMGNDNNGEETLNLRLSRNGASPPGGAYDTYAGGTTSDWRYAAFVRYTHGAMYFNSLNTGGDGRQGDRREGNFRVSHTYPYNWEQPGGWEHIRLYNDSYKVFDFHSNPSSLQTSRYGPNRFLWGYTGANSGQGIYGGSDSFTGNNNTNPGYMFVR